MCNEECLEFASRHLRQEEVAGKDVLEVGARMVQEPALTVRHVVGRLEPKSYVGVDIEAGPGVDEICAAEQLHSRYGDETFDVVVCTEVLEHVADWRGAVSNLKNVVRPGGVLLVTTRSRGFPYHGFPHDHWRYEPSDMEVIFGDLQIEALEQDRTAPGVFLKAVKPASFHEARLADFALYSIVAHSRTTDDVSPRRPVYVRLLRVVESARTAYRLLVPQPVRARLRTRVRRRWSQPPA